MTRDDALAWATRRLRAAGIDAPRGDAKRLLDTVAGALDDALDARQRARFEAMIARRAQREPVSHILGRRAFWTATFEVGPDVLDPRPDTETLVAAALDSDFTRVLDLGTGSGCILLSLLGERPDASGLGTDLSDAALAVARRNAARLGLEARADFARSDWFAGVEGRFDLIVSNPPYIAADEMETLAPEVRDWEPWLALTPGGDGLAAYRAIAASAGDHLSPGGRLLVEIGWRQRHDVTAIFAAAGLEDIACHTDLEGRERVISARFAGLRTRGD